MRGTVGGANGGPPEVVLEPEHLDAKDLAHQGDAGVVQLLDPLDRVHVVIGVGAEGLDDSKIRTLSASASRSSAGQGPVDVIDGVPQEVTRICDALVHHLVPEVLEPPSQHRWGHPSDHVVFDGHRQLARGEPLVGRLCGAHGLERPEQRPRWQDGQAHDAGAQATSARNVVATASRRSPQIDVPLGRSVDDRHPAGKPRDQAPASTRGLHCRVPNSPLPRVRTLRPRSTTPRHSPRGDHRVRLALPCCWGCRCWTSPVSQASPQRT
jgi:hypothetical protein